MTTPLDSPRRWAVRLGTLLVLSAATGCGPGELSLQAADEQGDHEGLLAVPGKDPMGFGVAGTHNADWKTDGRRWAYNWGHDPSAAALAVPGALYLPMVWGGPFCAKWGDLTTATLQSVTRYQQHVCADARCVIDAREVYLVDGKKHEVLVARGRRIEFRDGAFTSSALLTDVARYCGPKDANGRCTGADRPCYQKRADECRFETLAVATVGAERWESISAYGRYYNFELLGGALRNTNALTSVERYCGVKDAAGTCQGQDRPCFGKRLAECVFDTRTVSWTYESITAYGRYFNYDVGGTRALLSTDRLESVERYRYGACAGASATSPCVLHSRALIEVPGQSAFESISAADSASVGRYFNWDGAKPGTYCAPSDPSLLAYLADVQARVAKHPGPGQRWLIFNEPDVGGQANMPPEHAAEVYVRVASAILAKDSTARLYCCGTAPTGCNTPDCKQWMRRFSTALAGRAPVHAVHYHNYASEPGYPPFFSSQGKAVIASMVEFSNELQGIAGLKNRSIVVSEWSGLSNGPELLCGPGVNNRDDMMVPVAKWLVGPGRSQYRYQGAAWFLDYCGPGAGRNCLTSANLYDSADPSPNPWVCTQCRKNCLGQTYFGQVVPSWPVPAADAGTGG